MVLNLLTNKKTYLILFSVFSIFLSDFASTELLAATAKKSTSKSKSAKKSNTKKKKDSKNKSGRSTKGYSEKANRTPSCNVIKIDTLAPGIYYKKLQIGTSKYAPMTTHVLQADISNPDNKVEILKAKGNSIELDKLHDIIKYNNNGGKNDYEVLAAVNGSFWMAYHNYPMGSTVIEGEVVEMDTKWQTGFFDQEGKLYVDNFNMKGTIAPKHSKRKFEIEHVNRRAGGSGIVVYNKFAGNKIPYFTSRSEEQIMKEIIEEDTIDTRLIDSLTEDEPEDYEFDTLEFKREMHKLERNSLLDVHSPKIVVQYLDLPGVNKDIRCKVLSIDTGTVAMPSNGCVITYGNEKEFAAKIQPGDELTIRYSTDKMSNTVFTNAVGGTPIIVNNGEPKKIKGGIRYVKSKKGKKGKKAVKGKKGKKGKKGRKGKRGRRGRIARTTRFFYSFLPRTAIGISEDMNTMYLVAVPAANIENMGLILKEIGAFNAINLDGGGSTVMVKDNRNVIGCPECSRRVSVGVGVARKRNNAPTKGK